MGAGYWVLSPEVGVLRPQFSARKGRPVIEPLAKGRLKAEKRTLSGEGVIGKEWPMQD